MKKPLHIVSKKRRTIWIPEIHDKELMEHVRAGESTPQIARAMRCNSDTIDRHIEKLGLKANQKRVHKPMPFEKSPPAPTEKQNPLDLARDYIPGFNPATMCIHTGNTVERITLTKLMQMVNQKLKNTGMSQIDYAREWLV